MHQLPSNAPLEHVERSQMRELLWKDVLAACGNRWLSMSLKEYQSDVDFAQLIAHEECALEERLSARCGWTTEVHRVVLHGLLRMVVGRRLERENRLRYAMIRINVEAQQYMTYLAGLSVADRRQFDVFIVARRELRTTYAGSLGLICTMVVSELLGMRFCVSAIEEDMRYGIDAWVGLEGRDPVPVQVKTVFEQDKIGYELVTPDSELDLDNRMCFAWEYLEQMALPRKILLLRPNRCEGGASYRFEKSPVFASVMVEGLLAFWGQ